MSRPALQGIAFFVKTVVPVVMLRRDSAFAFVIENRPDRLLGHLDPPHSRCGRSPQVVGREPIDGEPLGYKQAPHCLIEASASNYHRLGPVD